MNAAHGHTHAPTPRARSYELGSCPRLPRLTHAASAAPAEQERLRLSPPSSRSRTISFAPRKGAAMAMAALRGASRCLASRGSAVAARPMLLAHSRGITYKLFIGGWLLTLIARLQSPPLLTTASLLRLPQSSALFPLAHLAAGEGSVRLLCGSFVARACVPSVRRNVRTGTAP